MSLLNRKHPAQLALGTVLIGEDIASKSRNATLAALCQDAATWATESRDILREVVADAASAQDIVRAAAADGKFTSEELAMICDLFSEIETEAREGRIL